MNRAIFVVCVLIGLRDAVFRELHNLLPDALNPLNAFYANICIEDYGCFYTGPPFYHPTYRPISLPPTYSVESVKFRLFTPSNPDEDFELESNLESLASSSFDPQLETKLLIHGFMSENEETDVRHETKDAMLEFGDYNVIIVDWTDINGPPYAQAVANTRIVGAVTAKLIQFLVNETSITPERFHVIGHSLGSHAAGYIGERIPNLGRITGLDPAGPYFQEAEAEVRLDPTDASFVDAIHTNEAISFTGGLGISHPVGHMDFYPNNGHLQPGCAYASSNNSVIGTAVNYTTQFRASSCDHSRANQYFLESINNTDCIFLSILCNDYADYEKSHCFPQNLTVAVMGFHNTRITELESPAKFYLNTNSVSPFCNQTNFYNMFFTKFASLFNK